ncbi:hypothetical protein ACF0H5_021157 [Mactra antiquata]
MDRGGRKSSVAPGGADSRKKGKWSVVQEKPQFKQMIDPNINNDNSKFKGSMVAPTLPAEDDSLVIDPNLLVGPLYVPPVSKSDRIKEQLGDITEKLHKTLYAFDDFEDFEHEDPLVSMRQKLVEIDDKDMKSQLSHFIDKYDNMSHQVSAANRDRDDMLLQLADWFTTDHVDLDDIKTSIEESEEEHMKQSYFSTITNFEKLKNLQGKIMNAGKNGKSSRQLEQKKLELEKSVVDSFRVMKDMSMQTMKLKVSDDAPWRHAANEIVQMLNSVRSENSDELKAISKKMQEMVDNLEKQSKTIRSMTAELREKKQVVQKLTDENGDLSQDVTMLRARYTRYEKDLQAAQTLIRRLHAERMADGGHAANQHTVVGKSLTESISKVLGSIDIQPEVKEMTSDPSLLRVQLREYQDALESIREEFSRASEQIEELNIELEEKKEYIGDMETENEKLTKDIRKLRQERRQSIAAGFIPPPSDTGDTHKCEHCSCHIAPKEYDEELEELKNEVTKWTDKCNYFKKILADTEMKLSDAFREISDLRMERELPPPAPVQKETEKEEPPAPSPVKQEKVEDIQPEPKPTPKPKPKRQVKARYLEKSKPASAKLPPIEQLPMEESVTESIPGLTQKQQRELKLFKSGDLQGKLNMLTSEIMDFVSEIGNMLHTDSDKQPQAKVQAMKAFDFNSQPGGKKPKEVNSTKDEETRQMKSAVVFNGQHACSKLREAFDMLSGSLNLQHNEYEAIYRSFKISQQRNNLRREIFMGRMPISALQEFDRAQRQKMLESKGDNLLNVYYNISYGGGGGGVMGVTGGSRRGGDMYHIGDDNGLATISDDEDFLGCSCTEL